jgi:hypothetical protein
MLSFCVGYSFFVRRQQYNGKYILMSHKSFCIAGPIVPDRNYFIHQRLDGQDIYRLIDNCEYFVLHAPRQSGKTSAILELCRELNRQGKYNSLYLNVEVGQAAREDVEKGLLAIITALLQAIENQISVKEEVLGFFRNMISDPTKINLNSLNLALEALSKGSPKPIVLFIDEIDALIGDTLLSVLRQIRAGFINRPNSFPHSLCLIGLRDVRDYKIWSREEGKHISASSPFNIKAKSMLLENFTLENVITLYHQHTQETGQLFSPEACEHAYALSSGQPWLINALAYQACYEDLKDIGKLVDIQAVDRAKEAIIKRCDTHLDSLIDKLRDPRVRPIIESIIVGKAEFGAIQSDDLQYVRDLGLIKLDSLEIANPIYKEIIPRELTSVTTEMITQTVTPFKNRDDSLNMAALISAFIDFYRENSAIWLEKFDYKEAGPHLLLMAFLQRVINGGGTLQREYALGTCRVDILVRWQKQTILVELKIKHNLKSMADGLRQIASYMDTSSASEGHLIIFDKDPKKTWENKIFHNLDTSQEKVIHIWGC